MSIREDSQSEYHQAKLGERYLKEQYPTSGLQCYHDMLRLVACGLSGKQAAEIATDWERVDEFYQ